MVSNWNIASKLIFCPVHHRRRLTFKSYKLEKIITNLVEVKPECRMKLEDARIELEDLNNELSNTNKKFTLLDPSLQILNDDVEPTGNETPTQISYGRQDDIRLSRMLMNSFIHEEDFSLPDASFGSTTQNSLRLMDEMNEMRINNVLNLTQQNTNLCVAYAAMRLLSYSLIEFLNRSGIFDPEYPEKERTLTEITNFVLRDGQFFKQLLQICCFVISPRSLTGLNHAHLDENFQLQMQVQNIRK